jgi:hypothetical protein
MISCIHPPFLVPGTAQRFIGALQTRDEEEFLQSDLPLLWCLRHALSGSIM